ncbi:MAG: class I SAM-dependent methyltransferase [Caldilineaceae bacterium]|nr:class I SAM-dependent methyltransferase [Caldilineaceae bacterium]
MDKGQAMSLLSTLPRPADRRIALHITRDAERHLRNGHPWLFADSIVRQSHEGKPGDLAVVFDQKRRFLAIGLYDPTSPIRLRVLQQGTQATIDRAWFHATLNASLQRRQSLLADARTTGYRLVYGESDGLPGCVMDRFGTTLVIKLYTAAWVPHLADLVHGIEQVQPAERIVLRMSRNMQAEPAYLSGLEEGMILTGPPLTGPVVFLEHGIRFEADPIHGQKTGFFLDQRENRARVEGLAAGKRVLNVFAYNGGFSLYAARGGATEVTSLDSSGPALAAAEHNFGLNQDDPAIAATSHKLLEGDAFRLLQQLAEDGAQYDLVIIDPPAFAKRQSEVSGALNAYAQLTRLGLGVLRAGGTIVLASCSSRISSADFVANAEEAATAAGRPLTIFARTDHALDHPIGFAEGAYLKCIYAHA